MQTVSAEAMQETAEFDGDPGLEPDRCLRLYRKLTGGVSIVSAEGSRGPVGLTASSVTSLSLRPPLLLVCIAVGSSTLAAIERSRAFSVQLMAEHQQQIAEDFATAGGARFTGTSYRHVLGVPVLVENMAWSVCLLRDVKQYGDHVLVVGEVIAAAAGSARPLVWHGQAFRRIAD